MDENVTEMLEEFMGSALVTWVGGKQKDSSSSLMLFSKMFCKLFKPVQRYS